MNIPLARFALLGQFRDIGSRRDGLCEDSVDGGAMSTMWTHPELRNQQGHRHFSCFAQRPSSR